MSQSNLWFNPFKPLHHARCSIYLVRGSAFFQRDNPGRCPVFSHGLPHPSGSAERVSRTRHEIQRCLLIAHGALLSGNNWTINPSGIFTGQRDSKGRLLWTGNAVTAHTISYYTNSRSSCKHQTFAGTSTIFSPLPMIRFPPTNLSNVLFKTIWNHKSKNKSEWMISLVTLTSNGK